MGVAAGALALVVAGGAIAYKKMLSDARKRGNELGEAFAGTTEFVKQAGAAYQKTSIVDQQLAEAKKTSVEQIAQGEQLLESDYGKQLVSGFNLVAERFGVQVASQQFTDKIVSAMVEGTMSGSDARGLLAALPDQTAAAMITKQIENIGGGKFGGISKNPTEAALKIMNRTANDIKLMSDFVARREEVFAQQDISAGSLESKANEIMRADKSNVSNQEKWIRAQQQAVEFYQKRSAEADQLGVSGINNEQLMQENSALVGQVWSESMKTAYRNRIAAEAQLNSQRQELKGLDPKSKEAITLKGDIQEGIKNIQEYDAANEKMVDGILDGYERMAQGGKTDPAMAKAREGMYGAVYDDVGKSIGPLGKLALEAAQGAGLSSRMEFEVALRMSTGELDPSLIFAAATGQKSLNVPMVLDITDKFGADKAGQFFSQILSMKDGAAEDILSGINTSGIKKIATDAGFSSKAVSRLIQSLKGLSGAASGGRGTSVPIPKVPKVDPNAGDSKRGNQAWGARYAAQARSAAKTTVVGAASAVQKIKTSWAKPSNAGALKPSSPVKVPVKYGEPKGEKSLKPKVVKIPVKYDQPRGEKALKPDPVQVKVSYDVVISAQDNATAIAVAVQAQIMAMQAAAAVPSVLSAIDAASPVIGAVTASLNALNGKTVHTYVVTHHQDTKAIGGLFRYATGGVHSGHGKVTGPGGPTEDKVNARLSDGEFVIRASSVKKYGTGFMDAINRGMYEKNGFKAGTPIKKAPFAPKDKDGDSRAVEFGNEWRAAMYEAQNFMREFNNMGKIIKHGRDVLGKGFKTLDVEFAQYISDNFSPRQIKKLFSKNDKGARTIKKQFQAEQKMEARDQNRSASLDVTAAQVSGSQVGRYGGMAAAYQNISAEDIKLGMSQPKMLNKIMKKRAAAEKANQVADFQRQVVGTDANIVAQLGGDSGLAKAAEQLGMSMTEIANAMANGYTAQQIKDLGTSAQAAAEALETSLMSALDKASERSDNFSQAASLESQRGEAQARIDISQVSSWNPSGLGQSQLQAKMAVAQAQADIKQGEVDDINKKYEKQLNIVDQISQYQQAIANLERGRLTVAGALSQGDIAAAAAAAQQQRTDTASFMQGQMRTQLENQQKAATVGLQKEIDDLLKASRDTQNQMNLALAKAQEIVAPMVDHYQAESDKISVQNGLIDDQIKKLMDRNALLASPTAAPTPATSETTTPAGGSPQGGVPEATADSNLEWQIVNSNISRLNDKDMKFLEKNTFGGTPRGGGAWKTKFVSWSADKRNKLMSAVSNGIISAAEEKTLKFAKGGRVPGFGNSDSIHSMLTPGEFVVNRAQATKFGPVLSAINSGSIKSPETVGGNVNIDNIIFQINGTNLNERDIADIAVRKMKGLDSATIRGGRF
jgi:hypothetical protein